MVFRDKVSNNQKRNGFSNMTIPPSPTYNDDDSKYAALAMGERTLASSAYFRCLWIRAAGMLSTRASALFCLECTLLVLTCLDENRTVSGPFLDHWFAPSRGPRLWRSIAAVSLQTPPTPTLLVK